MSKLKDKFIDQYTPFIVTALLLLCSPNKTIFYKHYSNTCTNLIFDKPYQFVLQMNSLGACSAAIVKWLMWNNTPWKSHSKVNCHIHGYERYTDK